MKKSPQIIDFVVFGGLGDLSLRKIMPALYYLYTQGYIDHRSRIISTARKPITVSEHHALVMRKLKAFVPPVQQSQSELEGFIKLHSCLAADAADVNSFTDLQKTLDETDGRERVYYLSTPSTIFGAICKALKVNGLVTTNSRVVLEKPLGHDLASFKTLDDSVTQIFTEEQIFRIDHYLGKDTVQNIIAMRFSNVMFMPLWNKECIDHVQITAAETVGVEGRWSFYDDYGALRDMIQNHLLQLLCLVAMEPPKALTSENLRAEKVKLLESLCHYSSEDVSIKTVRGQYLKGINEGKIVPGYLEDGEEVRISNTETFAAVRVDIDNERWQGVPFYLRTGKRMSERFSEIVIQFKPMSDSIFPSIDTMLPPNKLVIHIQPTSDIQLMLLKKQSSLSGGIQLREVGMELLAHEENDYSPTAYERLISDVINNDNTLFMRRDEVEAAWQWADCILNAWSEGVSPLQHYTAGTDGPQGVFDLIEKDGRQWQARPEQQKKEPA